MKTQAQRSEPSSGSSREARAQSTARNAVRDETSGLFEEGEAAPGRTARWASEASFFDQMTARIGARLAPLDPLVVQRYQEARRSWCNKEFRFQLLGDLRGQRVLDVGCGEGTNSVLMAKLGAHVTGIDISSGSIEVCNRRALLDGVEGRTKFICSPLETVDFEEGGFDVIWGDGVLHHLIPELPGVMAKLLRWAKPGALFVFSEPVSLIPALRRLRAGVPIHTDATPDERPLQKDEVEIVQRALPGLQLRWFDLFGRLRRFVVKGHFERASFARRAGVDALWRLDQALLSVPQLSALGGMCVMYGHAPGPRPVR